jgi:hypothetical protein
MMNQIIDERLFKQESQRLGISISQAQATAEQQLQQFENTAPSDPAHIAFQAYLCVNNLDPSTFATNPTVLQGYQGVLARMAVNQHIISLLPADQQQNPDAIQQAIANYTQNLRQAAHIQVFIPLQ